MSDGRGIGNPGQEPPIAGTRMESGGATCSAATRYRPRLHGVESSRVLDRCGQDRASHAPTGAVSADESDGGAVLVNYVSKTHRLVTVPSHPATLLLLLLLT